MDVEKAVTMLLEAVGWRVAKGIDDEIVRKGDSVGLKDSLSVDEKAFMTQYRSGKSFVRGLTRGSTRLRCQSPTARS